MKQLQNNFTTPEQSKLLLELGVPADSADFFYKLYTDVFYGDVPHFVLTIGDSENLRFGNTRPCWSVGRLIEIATLCVDHYTGDNKIFFDKGILCIGNVEFMIALFQVALDDGDIDFSKLEE